MSKIATNLSTLRTQNGYSQSQLAEKLCVTPQCVSRWELGKTEPDIDTLTKISVLFNCSVDDLVGANEIEPSRIPSDLKRTLNIAYIVTSVVMVCFGIYLIFDFIFIKSSVAFLIFFFLSLVYLIFVLTSEIIQHREKAKKKNLDTNTVNKSK